jgi:hypothetical protein
MNMCSGIYFFKFHFLCKQIFMGCAWRVEGEKFERGGGGKEGRKGERERGREEGREKRGRKGGGGR